DPGITNFVTVSLLGKGGLRLQVRQANGAPGTNALVQVDQRGFPSDHFSGQADAAGIFALDNLFAGQYGISVAYLGGLTRLEGRTSIDVAVGTVGEGVI